MKKLLIITALFLCTVSLHAQESPFLKKAYQYLIKPEEMDSTRIYQPSRACFSLGVFTTEQRAGFDVDVHFKMDFGHGETIPGL